MNMPEFIVAQSDTDVVIQIKVIPGASRTRVEGQLGSNLKIAVAAPPEKGKANQAVVKHLSEVLDLPRTSIELVSGDSSPRKMLRLCGQPAQLIEVLSALA